jgi:hypothetical protein
MQLSFYKAHQKDVAERKAKDIAFWQDLDKALRTYEEVLVQQFSELTERAVYREE